MGVFAAQNAVQAAALVRTLTRHVTELLAIATLDSWVGFDVVSSHLIFKF